MQSAGTARRAAAPWRRAAASGRRLRQRVFGQNDDVEAGQQRRQSVVNGRIKVVRTSGQHDARQFLFFNFLQGLTRIASDILAIRFTFLPGCLYRCFYFVNG